MIDWHNHILPALDDGSKDVSESIAMLEMQRLQGVNRVIATPHFYANDEAVDSFIEKRNRSFEELKKNMSNELPEILLGAEVRYYPGISRMNDLKLLTIEKSRLFLLEMPISQWSESMVRELIELSNRNSVQIVLAHIDRYISFQKDDVWKRLYENGILMQVNSSFFTSIVTKRKAISLLREGKIHFIGSDCHNVTTRPPQIGKAFERISKKLGDDYLGQMNEYGYSMFATTNK